jgi:hypothetical protein
MVTCGEGTDKERSHNRIIVLGIVRLERKIRKIQHMNSRGREVSKSEFGIGPWS